MNERFSNNKQHTYYVLQPQQGSIIAHSNNAINIPFHGQTIMASFRKAVSIRRNDGQIKQCEVKIKNGLYCKKSSRDVFKERKRIFDFVDGTQSLIVCEKTTSTIDEPFTRKLPGCLSHDLFFGDLLIVYIDFRNIMCHFLVEDLDQITNGSHPLWCVHSSTDIGEKEGEFGDDDISEEEEDESDEDEEKEDSRSESEDEDVVGSDDENDSLAEEED